VLIAGGNLIRRCVFPPEVLPIVTVVANMVHFLPRASRSSRRFCCTTARAHQVAEIAWFPVVILVQLLLTSPRASSCRP